MSENRVRFTTELPYLLTIGEFADVLRMKKQTVRGWIAQRRVQFIRIKPGGRGNGVRIPRSELELILNSGLIGVSEDGGDLPPLDEEDEDGLMG